MSAPNHDVHPAKARWTHVALRVNDIDATIAWYADFTPMELLDRREDEDSIGAWLGMSDMIDNPFILVVVQFLEGRDPFASAPHAVLGPFAHFGVELPEEADIDAIAARGREADCLTMPPTMMPAPIGYICMLRDPDDNTVEFSWDQGVYTTVRDRWGSGAS